MTRYECECVGCPPELGCIGMACPNLRVPHYHCDECDTETDIYEFDGEELCISCITDRLPKVGD